MNLKMLWKLVEKGGRSCSGGESSGKDGILCVRGTGGRVAECLVGSDGLRGDSEPQNVNPAVLRSAKTPHFH